MVYPDWRQPAAALSQALGTPSAAQIALARLVGMPLTGQEPRVVVAAALEDHLAPAIRGTEARPPSEKQLMFLASLCADAHFSELESLTFRSASAWIDYFLGLKTLAALRNLRLARGDTVEHRRPFRHPTTGEEVLSVYVFEVSSIRKDGLVFFRGGNGKCGWPSALSLIHRSSDAT